MALAAASAAPAQGARAQRVVEARHLHGAAMLPGGMTVAVAPRGRSLPSLLTLRKSGRWQRHDRFRAALRRSGPSGRRVGVEVAAAGRRLVLARSRRISDSMAGGIPPAEPGRRAIFAGTPSGPIATLDRCAPPEGLLQAAGRVVAYVRPCTASPWPVVVRDVASGKLLARVAPPAGRIVGDLRVEGDFVAIFSCGRIEFQGVCREATATVSNWRTGQELYTTPPGLLEVGDLDVDGSLLAPRCSSTGDLCDQRYWHFTSADAAGRDTGVAGGGPVRVHQGVAVLGVAGPGFATSKSTEQIGLLDVPTGKVVRLTRPIDVFDGRLALGHGLVGLAGPACGGGTRIVVQSLATARRAAPVRFC